MTTATLILDLQFGSTGKGLIAGYLSERNLYDVVVSANMPNAGHTFIGRDGMKVINKVLPSGVYSKNLNYIMIGPGAVFDPERLVYEIGVLRASGIGGSIKIHPAAAILLPHHKDREAAMLSGIASTMQGSMEAAIHKMRRDRHSANVAIQQAEHLSSWNTVDGCNINYYVCDYREWDGIMLNARNILVEGSQGYSLGINAGFYPYCTSRDCTVWRLLADCGIPAVAQRTVIGTARTYPIRVGNTQDGSSGPHYPDQQEVTWEALGVEPERTTVTNRVRRVFTFSKEQIRDAIYANGVDQVFLNFCNYAPAEAIRIVDVINQLGAVSLKHRGIGVWEGELPQFVRYMGFGPTSADILEYKGYTT